MTTQPIKLGIIGTGIATQDLHFPALNALTDKFQIAAVCNRSIHKAQRFADRIGDVPVYSDYRELLANPEIEAVSIVLPFHLNLVVLEAAISAGKHAIFEKPIATTLDSARRIRVMANEAKTVNMVAENYRYHQTLRRTRELIDEGAIGTPFTASWDQMSFIRQDNKFANTDWRTSEAYPGAFVVDGGIHNVAALRDLFGDLEVVSAQSTSQRSWIGPIDGISISFRSVEGLMGTHNLSFSAAGRPRNQIHIVGDKGSITVEQLSKINLSTNEGQARDEYVLRTDSGYIGEFDDFFKAIRRGTQPVSSVDEAYRDFEFLMAAIECAGNA